MVGLNHEFARELLWREYPTDQRGTRSASSGTARRTHPAWAPTRDEKLHDIPELHTLAAHVAARRPRRPRGRPGENEQEVVLVIRGELLKKYPTAVIYAQRARWQRKPDGSIDPAQERELERADRGRGGRAAAREAAHARSTRPSSSPTSTSSASTSPRRRRAAARRGSRRRPGVVLRHQGAPGRAALRLRRRPRAGRCRPSTTWPGRTRLPGGAPGAHVAASAWRRWRSTRSARATRRRPTSTTTT